MIPQMRGEEIISENFDKNIFYGPIKKIPASFSAADKQKYTVLYQNAIKTKIIPAYTRMGDFLEKNICQKREIQMELTLFQMEAIFTRISQNLGLPLILLLMKSIKLG